MDHLFDATKFEHFETAQHPVTQCNALQRTATHCNTLQHLVLAAIEFEQFETPKSNSPIARAATHIASLQHLAYPHVELLQHTYQ